MSKELELSGKVTALSAGSCTITVRSMAEKDVYKRQDFNQYERHNA